jgi:UDP-N-acetylmuramoyl-L-alanyl-D-glutamate--2,6-diaminopimelate ligase
VREAVSVSALLEAIGDRRVVGTPPAAVARIVADSRQVEPGDCFVAVPGFKQDARRFVPDAAARGARLIVTEGEALPVAACQVLVPSARLALARLADAWHRHPSRDVVVVGITGTNGKTTTSYLVEALLSAHGLETGVIGTVQYRVRGATLPAGQTTPEALDLQGLLARMRDEGVRGVAMEVSSHALALARVEGIEFDVAVFTNLTQDHLDFHGTLEEYRSAKRHLFELLARSSKSRRTAVVNADDPAGRAMVDGLDVRVLTFGLGQQAMVRASAYESGLDGIRMTVDTPHGPLEIASPLVGQHNVMNLLGAVATGLALDIDGAVMARALAGVAAVPGRFERVDAGQPFLVVVDYAHTPDALERVLTTARLLTPGRLAVVFGCGGDRDRGKRPIMGEIAARLADRVWVTSDNPRSERPEAIIDEIMVGVRRASGRSEGPSSGRPAACVTLPQRHVAIREALTSASSGDTVVIAGKGHETYQIIGSDVLPFDDRAIARQILAERSS